MEEKELNDEEVISALECCINGLCSKDCPHSSFYANETVTSCQDHLCVLAFDLINRLQEKIKQYEKQLDDKCDRCIDRERKNTAQEIFKKVYGYTSDDEVGTRYLIRELALEYGVELPKMPRKGLNGFEVKK